MGLNTSLLELNNKQEKEVKLRKISRTKRLSTEQITDLFNVRAGVCYIYVILSSCHPADCRADPAGRSARQPKQRRDETEKSWLQTEHQCQYLSLPHRPQPTSENHNLVFVLILKGKVAKYKKKTLAFSKSPFFSSRSQSEWAH